MTRNGGNMADPGSVSYLFNRKGVVIVSGGSTTEDALLEAVLEAGAQEVNNLGENFEVICEPTDLVTVRKAVQAAGLDYESAEATFLPDLYIPLDADGAGKMFKLLEALEDSDEVQNVYANFDVSDEIMAQLDV
jgi:transcriptional/translational regulatory protein YebC/TACO1